MSLNIKNAIVFKAELPSAKEITEHLEAKPFIPVSELGVRSHGFVPNRVMGELVPKFEVGYALTFRLDEKVIPNDALKSEVEKKLAEIAERQPDRKVTRKERGAIRETILAEFIPKALVRTIIVNAYYHIKDNILIVDTPNMRIAQMVMSDLVLCTGSVKTETVNVSDLKYGLTAKFDAFLQGKPAHDCFGDLLNVSDSVQLSRKVGNEAKEVVNYRNIDLPEREDLQELIGMGFSVESISLESDNLEFKLDSEFKLKGFKWTDAIEQEFTEIEDGTELWQHEATVKVIILNDVVKSLVSALEYKEDAQVD